jgi:hypothetical protein
VSILKKGECPNIYKNFLEKYNSSGTISSYETDFYRDQGSDKMGGF